MSGGHFDYIQYRFEEVATEIECCIARYGDDYPQDVIDRFKLAADHVRRSAKMINRIDWLVSDDDGPESFLSRWAAEVENAA